MPMATISPIIEMRFSVMVDPANWRIKYMIRNTHSADTGMDAPMISVDRKLRRKMKIATTARIPPDIADWPRLVIPVVTSSDRSLTIRALSLSPPTSSRMVLSSARTSLAVLTILAVEDFCTSSEIDSRPSRRSKLFFSG